MLREGKESLLICPSFNTIFERYMHRNENEQFLQLLTRSHIHFKLGIWWLTHTQQYNM